MKDVIFINRVVLKNYRSIKECSVELGPFSFLVGQNGAGKSNFLDALRLVSDSLNTSLEHALRDRGGIGEVRRRSSGHPTHFGIRLEWRIAEGYSGYYAFIVGAKEKGGFEVQKEECLIRSPDIKEDFFTIESGNVKKSSMEIAPPAIDDRLYLVAAAGIPAFRLLYDALSHMGFYNLNPDEIRELQPPDPGEILHRDGGNLASVLSRLKKENPALHDRVVNFLSKVVPGVQTVEVQQMGKKETLAFRQHIGTNKDPWRFPAESMSDGTLRALGVLTALFQSVDRTQKKVRLVGIEEPEVAVHPGAAGVIRDALRDAAQNTQVIVTSHSPDLLDDKDISDDNIISVVNINGETRIAPIDIVGRNAIKDRLYTAGELLRMNQLNPDPEILNAHTPEQFELFS